MDRIEGPNIGIPIIDELNKDKAKRPRRLWDAAPPQDPFSQMVWQFT